MTNGSHKAPTSAHTLKPVLLGMAAVGLLVGLRMIAQASSRYELRGKVAIITGGSRGLGLVLARQLAAKGVRLAICARTKDQLLAARDELIALGGEVFAATCDVTKKPQVNSFIEDVFKYFGRIDILINNAGMIQVGPMETMTEENFQQAMKVHFWAPLYMSLAVLPHFRDRGEGRIVNVSSIGGKIAVPHLLPYSASKFALVGLSEGMAAELRKENILVTTITPGLMRTGSPRNIDVKGDHEKEYAWFKTAASLPALSEEPFIVARKIVEALECNIQRPALSRIERVASVTKELAPKMLAAILSRVNQFLPANGANGMESRKGYQSESRLSMNRIAQQADADARLNNEL